MKGKEEMRIKFENGDFYMRNDFFDALPIKALTSIPKGDHYLMIYLKLLIEAAKYGGFIDEDYPVKNLACNIDEEPDEILETIKWLTKFDLVERQGIKLIFKTLE